MDIRYDPFNSLELSANPGIGKRNLSEKLPGISRQITPKYHTTSQKKTFIKIYENLEKLCDTYEELPSIEHEDQNLKDTTKKLIPQKPSFIEKDSKLKYLISQLKERIKSRPMNSSVIIKSNRFKIQSQTDEKVGPGSYVHISPLNSESHEFSNIPRLKSPISHNIYYIEAVLPKKHPENSIIRRNKNFVGNFTIIKEKKESFAYLHKDREKEALEMKKSIEKLKREERVKKIDKKMKLFEQRILGKKAYKAKKGWMSLLAILGMLKVIKGIIVFSRGGRRSKLYGL
ncbi:hypothetical protein SteCoe_36219 [Stentor coeruleus]|uniref:Uncharacterized protein n=1 Tax=Stentor coeruleus TaxID=5963 RepID=A0A1R2AQJ3_9CILI|nr:hypothetical protein SteCoe_36219 [Stentor coeruleus]